MADEGNDSSNSGSALDRYLKKQAAANVKAPEVTPAPAFGAQAKPALNLNINPEARAQYEPAGFWRRAGASTIDSVILMVLKSVVSIPVTVVLMLFFRAQDPKASGVPTLNLTGNLINMAIGLVLMFIGLYFYYGWFYSNKGGTPGKLVLGLKVLDTRTGTYLDYKKTILREFVGKGILGVLTLGIGYLMAAFTAEKRALHDKVFDTRVVRARKGQ